MSAIVLDIETAADEELVGELLAAGPPAPGRAAPLPARSVLPRLSGSGAEATSSWVYGCAGCCVISSAGPRSTI